MKKKFNKTFNKPASERIFKEKEGLVYGMRPLMEAIKNGADIDSIFVQQGLKGDLFTELMTLIKEKDLLVKRVPIEKLNRLTVQNHQGVAAFISPVKIYQTQELLPELLEQEQCTLLILDRISDVRNFGAICRTAEAMGVDAVIIPEGGSAPVNADALRTSTGSLLNIKICKEKNLAHTLDILQEHGVQIFCATEKAEENIFDVQFPAHCAIVMGNEETGISKEILHHADGSFKIPLKGNTSSLNVSVATGMALLELTRKRISS